MLWLICSSLWFLVIAKFLGIFKMTSLECKKNRLWWLLILSVGILLINFEMPLCCDTFLYNGDWYKNWQDFFSCFVHQQGFRLWSLKPILYVRNSNFSESSRRGYDITYLTSIYSIPVEVSYYQCAESEMRIESWVIVCGWDCNWWQQNSFCTFNTEC